MRFTVGTIIGQAGSLEQIWCRSGEGSFGVLELGDGLCLWVIYGCHEVSLECFSFLNI